MKITTINGLRRYLKTNSGFSGKTINSVIIALGYHPLHGTSEEFKELSGIFKNCTEHGAKAGFTGFSCYSETIKFFKNHQTDIVSHMENLANEIGIDIISMVQNFGVFYQKDKPSISKVGKALWDNSKNYKDLKELYNVFSWYVLEEISNTWYRYLEDNPGYMAELAA
ncbi:DUF7222 domain-containing protein [Treponema sp. R80B11-R83G3]